MPVMHTSSGDTGPPHRLTAVLGAWLFISAFVWDHAAPSFANSWITGLSITLVSALSAFAPRFRWLNTILGIWLFVSTLAIDHATVATLWHNAIVAVAVFGISLLPATADRSP